MESRRRIHYVCMMAGVFLGGLAIPPATLAESATPGSESMDFFEAKIRPVLIENCYKCHSVDGKRKGGLWLDSRAGMLEGGESGPVLAPGAPEKSRIIEAVRYKNPKLQMPPDGPLSAGVVADFETWVRMGAPDPR